MASRGMLLAFTALLAALCLAHGMMLCAVSAESMLHGNMARSAACFAWDADSEHHLEGSYPNDSLLVAQWMVSPPRSETCFGATATCQR